MKGPGLRIDLDVRRMWRCPRCGRTVRTAGKVVSQRCQCAESGVWMRLDQPPQRAPFVAPAREPIPDDPDDAASQLAEAPLTNEEPSSSNQAPPLAPEADDDFCAGLHDAPEPGQQT
jgi:hypothetical protein